MAVSGVAHPQDGWPAAVFFPFGHPMPYAYTNSSKVMATNVLFAVQNFSVEVD
jgi:hypothetical protein